MELRLRLASVRSGTAGVMTALMRSGRDRRLGEPVMGHAILSACFCLGPDQRITSGPAP